MYVLPRSIEGKGVWSVGQGKVGFFVRLTHGRHKVPVLGRKWGSVGGVWGGWCVVACGGGWRLEERGSTREPAKERQQREAAKEPRGKHADGRARQMIAHKDTLSATRKQSVDGEARQKVAQKDVLSTIRKHYADGEACKETVLSHQEAIC